MTPPAYPAGGGGGGGPGAIGARLARRDGPAKVAGAALYAADVALPGTLWGAVLRSPLAHARILSIDVGAARAVPGVHAVLTGADLPDTLAGRSLSDVPLLTRDVARYVGDRVAAVAAESPDVAEAALALIQVEYEDCPAVFSPAEATAADAPILHADFMTYRGAPRAAYPQRNACAYEVLSRGDVEVGFNEADLVIEHTYTTPPQHQGYLEPHSCLVSWDPAGCVRVWASNKAPFLLRDELARVLDVPADHVVVESTFVGGDFGGKGSSMDIPLAAQLARASGRPVRMILSSVEEMTAANPRHAAEVTVTTGVRRDGHIVARSLKVVFDGGAYAGYKPIPGVNLAGKFWSVGPYAIPHTRFESLVVYTNNPPAGHMRAPGEAQIIFASEVNMDQVAVAIGMDPLSFRELNAVADGETGPLGEAWHSTRLRECLAQVRAASRWDEPCPPGIGRGVAVSHCAGGMGASSARVKVCSDGRVELHTGASDQGSGSHMVLLQIASRELDVPLEAIELVVGGTDSAPFDSGASASRVTYVAGTAVQRAAGAARQQLLALAAEFLGCPEERVGLEDGSFFDRERTESALDLPTLAARGIPRDTPIVGEGRFQDYSLADTPSFGALVAEVAVDGETGTIEVRRLTGAYDVGTVINAHGVDGQIDGGLMQGLGAALMEEVRRSDGRIETVSLADYKVPTVLDVPLHVAELITDAPGVGPYGAKSIGELTNPLPPPALANAVYAAVGARLTSLPLSAERVRDAMP